MGSSYFAWNFSGLDGRLQILREICVCNSRPDAGLRMREFFSAMWDGHAHCHARLYAFPACTTCPVLSGLNFPKTFAAKRRSSQGVRLKKVVGTTFAP